MFEQPTMQRVNMKSINTRASLSLAVLISATFLAVNVQAVDSHGHGHGHKGKGGDSEMPCGMMGNMPAFADFDADGDGAISEAEFNKFHAERMSQMAAEGRKMKHAGDMPGFAGIDTDGSGSISPEELAAHQAEHQKNRHGKKHHGGKHDGKTQQAES
jgi:hypothetical protein